MNELQKREFEILKIFVNVCDKLGLKYYLVCGSALGAVKYGGFIPWDDDVDVAMPREDYAVFCENAQKLLPDWLFLQNFHTDPRFPKVFTKLRDSRTTYIESDYRNLDINHGVFIDVFALDGYPENESEISEFENKKRSYLRKTSCSLDGKLPFKSSCMRTLNRLLGYHNKTAELLAEYENLILSVTKTDRKYMCNYGNFRGRMELTERDIYGDGADMVFEGLSVKVPEKYDLYLRTKYGNYEEDPPIDQQVGHHYYSVCDLDKSYTEYFKK